MADNDVLRVAIHEAGHAVMAVELRLKFDEVTIVPNDDYAGQVKTSLRLPNLEDASEQTVRPYIMLLLAGNAAEWVFRRKIGRQQKRTVEITDQRDDQMKAHGFASQVSADDKEASAYIDWLHQRARNLLRFPPNRVAIWELATTLLQKGTVSSKVARRVIAAGMKRGQADRSLWRARTK